ncbi:MAG TPA: alkanesulfonate monooxygenase [Dehalococcoidia bacterium]|jgi:alkanesulfonate monooxygenase|nr:alkanesulfonate monooxygenase [Dehalococcoidia bacterium]
MQHELEIIGMIGTQKEENSQSGASLSVFGGVINPGSEIPVGLDKSYISEFSKAHETSGFDKVLIGYSAVTPDGFAVASYAASETTTLGFLIAHRSGFVAPTLAARLTATLDQLTDGRIALHVISGGSDADQHRDGDWLSHDERYKRTSEYIQILKNTWTSKTPFNFNGEFYTIENGYSEIKPYHTTSIPLYFGGASSIANTIGGLYADVYALWGEPLESIKEQIQTITAIGSNRATKIQFSLSVRPIIAKTEKLAWEKANSILEKVKQTLGNTLKSGESSRPQSMGSRRVLDHALSQDTYDSRLWMPIALASGASGSTTALVGTSEQVVDSLIEYYKLGCSKFIIRGFDPLSDTIEYGHELIPMLKEKVSLLSEL